MGVAPDFGAEVNSGEDGCGVYPNVVEDIGTKGSDKGKWVIVKVGDAGEVAKEVPIDELLLWDPEFLAAVVDDCILMRVAVDGEGATRGGKEVGKDVG